MFVDCEYIYYKKLALTPDAILILLYACFPVFCGSCLCHSVLESHIIIIITEDMFVVQSIVL